MTIKKEILYQLETPLTYAKAGVQAEGSFISLAAPTSKNMTECAFLKQAFFRSLPKTKPEDREQVSETPEITGEGVITLITMSKDVDLSGVLLTAKELFTSGIAMVDGEVKLTKPLLDSMSQDDLEAMTGEYMANFILASALRKLKTT
jgi:hypothetical protein